MPEIPNQKSQPEAGQPVAETSVPTQVNSVAPKFKLPTLPKTINKEIIKSKFQNLNPKNRKIVIGVGVLFALILFLLLLNIMATLFRGQGTAVKPTPTPSSIPSSPGPIIITNPSRYATDAGVLKMESDINAIDGNLKNIDPQHSQIAIPNLDFNVKFQ